MVANFDRKQYKPLDSFEITRILTQQTDPGLYLTGIDRMYRIKPEPKALKLVYGFTQRSLAFNLLPVRFYPTHPCKNALVYCHNNLEGSLAGMDRMDRINSDGSKA